jgi:hypothetical protein
MTWSDLKRTLTTPPPPRPPPPKHPIFTKAFFSTKSFGPGHLVGAGAFVFGLVGLAKLFIGLGKEEAERALRRARPSEGPRPLEASSSPERGRYRSKP